MFIIMIIAVLGWVAVGAQVARSVHTHNYRQWLMGPRTTTPERLTLKQWSFTPEGTALVHFPDCNAAYSSLWRQRGCDCQRGRAAYEAYLETPVPIPPPEPMVLPIILLWPYSLLRNYVTAPTRKMPDPVKIAEAEAEPDRQIKDLP